MSLPLVRPVVETPHGLKRYRHRTHKCRCDICRAAWADYIYYYRKSKRKNRY